ncbi:agmatine deiminase family protein [Amnibacterium sp. CER49]|uniref:agmatine deiminase family protein n=1 Tax=Amnibacterium sp. CER49 TaxID=3039161 RepID=UPI002448ACB1|nr:agmatine deiminase family protein [Amnibacterium sp. CER49]MDH2445190.1 agmatine deiminase family protein [Amnibacterium sp. CER49]
MADWRMPAETERHERTWMAFPRPNDTLGATQAEADEAYAAWTAVAHAVLEFEPVTMLVDPVERGRARRMLSSEVELLEAPLNDFWLRDSGPTFVTGKDGRLGAVDWVFNGWGAQDWARWDRDALLGRLVGEAAGAEVVPSSLVQEGGAIHVDGRGTVLVTETVQLDPHRNPGATKEQVEAELARTLGTTTTVWLPRGLTRDYERFGTRGHIDMILTVPAPGMLLVHRQDDREHPDFEVTRGLRQVLEAAVDAEGEPFTIVDVPGPARIRDEDGFVDWNYVNHLAVNGGVVACSYGEDVADGRAREVLESVYPGRRVVAVEARPILARGGGIHCITQQQPAAGVSR